MYLDYYEKRKYIENLGKKWRSEVKDNEDIVLGSSKASDMIPSLQSIVAFYEAKKDSLANSIRDRIEAIDEKIEFEKGLIKDLEDNPDCFKY
tara:strand:- start:1064 stop:1339 length:276 start_codon:yes stop_codon:yes gene_type:complete